MNPHKVGWKFLTLLPTTFLTNFSIQFFFEKTKKIPMRYYDIQ